MTLGVVDVLLRLRRHWVVMMDGGLATILTIFCV